MCGGSKPPPYGIWTIVLIKVGFLLCSSRETHPYFCKCERENPSPCDIIPKICKNILFYKIFTFGLTKRDSGK